MPENRPTVAVSRPDEPYDWQAEGDYVVDDDLGWLMSTRALLALAAVAALLVGVCCTTVGLILTAPAATWTGVGLLTAGVLVLRGLWVRGQE